MPPVVKALLMVGLLRRFSSSIDSSRYVRGKLATSDKPLTFNQPWTTEEQVGLNLTLSASSPIA